MAYEIKEPARDGFYRAILDAIPSPVFVVGEDVRIIDLNSAASTMLKKDPSIVIRQRAGDTLHCIHSTETPEGCGRAPYCKACIIRASVNRSLDGQMMVRQKAKLEKIENGRAVGIHLLITTSPFTNNSEKLVLLILEDITELVTLQKMLPICANCKKIRDDKEYWQHVESYLNAHLDIEFTHGLCPECAKALYPQFYEE
jgi:PAS domain-containing protein